ncbi:YdeI/OmpD-associated family protein [Kineococcus indalonis]|uniref:YdeI/OmpD-associated family protein n=1 Tax=Kineococcus indalonis TaxID=2696566 RepID=UPI0014124A30|nr:YdeI/OmpD-associated family protein [Kineococcus indalonis]NAZ84538.1 hypothetical protein [Kineococcus indalonis]
MAVLELPELLVADARALRAWLAVHHASSPGVWLVLGRKGGALTSLTWQQAVDEALCVGWIDGQGRKRDEQSSLVRYTPRGRRSAWSQRNVANVARLREQGLVLPAGLAAVAAAQADGRWEAAYAAPSQAQVPADLASAIAADAAAQAMFEVLTRTNRYAMIHRLGALKRAETRRRRIEEFVAMLARGETIHPQRARPPAAPPPPGGDGPPQERAGRAGT